MWDGFNESQTAMAALADQNLTRKSLQEFAQSQARYWRSGAINKIYPTGLGAEDIDEYSRSTPSGSGSTGSTPATGSCWTRCTRCS